MIAPEGDKPAETAPGALAKAETGGALAPEDLRLEYALVVPNKRPVVLSFGIAMRPDITEKSDGVTFSLFIGKPDSPAQVFREHYTRAEWRDFDIDLSPFAGKEVLVRFQTEPGEARNPGFDFSLLGDPKFIVGGKSPSLEERVAELTATKAYRPVPD